MAAVERRGVAPSGNEDFERRCRHRRRHRRLPAVTCPSASSRSARHAPGRPVYVSFVSKATLWDRGLCRDTRLDRPNPGPSLCPRFLSHMKARPEDLRPTCFLSSRSGPLPPPPPGTTPNASALAGPRRQTPEGDFHRHSARRGNVVQSRGSVAGRRPAVVVPCPPVPVTPPPSTVNPTPPLQNTSHADSRTRGRQSEPSATPASRPDLHPVPEEEDEVQEWEPPPPAGVSTAEPDQTQRHGPAGPERSPSPTSAASHGSLSDLSRPPSSSFSRSTDLASGRSSVLSSAEIGESDPEDGAGLSPLQPRPMMRSPLASASSDPRRSSTGITTLPPLHEPVFGQTKPTSGVPPGSDGPLNRREGAKTTENLPQSESVDPAPDPASDSDRGLVTLAFPSATWSSCPSPQGTTPHSAGSGPKLTPSSSAARLESRRWPVLPPISPVRGRCGTAASRDSELSCASPSRAFDELEAVAPRSTSCRSLDEPADSSGRPSPDTELSPGLAALTVGCDSGNLGSLSRVQLLLLDRLQPETPLSPFGPEEGLSPEPDWSDPGMQSDPELTSAGVSRPPTAGGVSESCNSAGKVRENTNTDQSDGGSGSPSSWIIDPSPSCDMFRSTDSPESDHGEGGPAESSYPGWRESSSGGRRPGSVDRGDEEEMEERKTKALSLLSKLQGDKRPPPGGGEGRCNFEDFDFLAKYCIFSQEKLAEYKRAFEAEDGDGDGYISCLQVLLALKNIIPPDLLSDKEEIYVYRILEMVDFRVTDGLVDLRLFAVISSLAQKIATMDEFMRSLISDMDFRSLEVRLFKAKQLFLFLLEEQRGDAGAQRGFISAEQLLLELKAGGIRLEVEAAVRRELQHIPPLDLLDFLAYLPLFMLIHRSIIANPLDDSRNL